MFEQLDGESRRRGRRREARAAAAERSRRREIGQRGELAGEKELEDAEERCDSIFRAQFSVVLDNVLVSFRRVSYLAYEVNKR